MKPSLSQTSILFLALGGILASQSALAQPNRHPIEVRFVAKDGGVPFTFSSGKLPAVKLEPSPLLRTVDFVRAEARAVKNSNKSSRYDLEIVYSDKGKARFNAALALGRERKFCVIIAGRLKKCSDFGSSQKDLHDQGQVISGLDRGESLRLASTLEGAIRTASAEITAAERATKVASARELLDVLYKRAVRERGPDWIGGSEREAFLVRDLVDLWDRVDVAMAAGNRDALLDSDPVAATNGLRLRTYQIEMEQERATMATANVTLRYAERAPQQMVRYILVKERGNWRIADIGNEGESLKGALQAFVRPPAVQKEK
jgi:hypothetical protein